MEIEETTLGGGCFWCIEAALQLLDGVSSVKPGYAGGKIKNPTYREVCSGLTGHAEVVQITFNPDIISFEKILEVFFSVHDPTTPNRQGADVGSQYRSIILAHNDHQLKSSKEIIQKLDEEKIFDNPIVTQVEMLKIFYPAEAYHVDYYKNNPSQPYCSFVVKPKVDKVKRVFSTLLK
ncbi:peptide-methionine (S)-S-oxide reductase MsrA [Fulvivirga sedimenti]|nr:peptide-methionine (S)-S-oxide reductase MsrA [Fulvivirga sedimenti]